MTLAASSRAAFVDANVPMYAAGQDHSLKEPCIRVMRMVASRPEMFLTDAEVLQEVMHRYLAVRRWDFGRDVLDAFARAMEGRVEPVYAEDVLAAARLAGERPGVSSLDLLHASVARRIGVSRIISTDAHFDVLPGVERLAPERIGEWGATLATQSRLP